jgi:hypothetical protein
LGILGLVPLRNAGFNASTYVDRAYLVSFSAPVAQWILGVLVCSWYAQTFIITNLAPDTLCLEILGAKIPKTDKAQGSWQKWRVEGGALPVAEHCVKLTSRMNAFIVSVLRP